MAETEKTIPEIDGMDDKAFDALKSDMMAGKDVSVSAEPEQTTEPDDPEELDAIADAEPVDATGEPVRQENVPFGRFERERQRRKEAETERETLRQRDSEREDRLLQIMEALAPRPQQNEQAPPEIPRWDGDDPLAAGKWTQDKLIEVEQQIRQREAQEREQQETGQVYAIAQSQFSQAASSDPAMMPTYNELMLSFAREIAFNKGIPFEQATPQQQQYIRSEVANLETSHIKYAVGTRQNAAEYIKGLAAARGIAARAPAATQQQPDPAKLIANADGLAQIRKAGASLTPSGGSAARTGMPSPQELLDMTPKQFEEWRAKNDIRTAFAA